jgi:hypothetical protein
VESTVLEEAPPQLEEKPKEEKEGPRQLETVIEQPRHQVKSLSPARKAAAGFH